MIWLLQAPPGMLLFGVLIVVFAIVVRLVAGSLDRSRIEEHLAQRGAKAESIAWQPFGRGWFGEKGERIYEVEYVRRDGRKATATAKTSAFSGVYWTDDAPEGGSDDDAEVDALREENARLKEELERRRG